MTTIVGMLAGGCVHIAADSLVTTAHDRVGYTNKLIVIGEGADKTCIAVAGSLTAQLALRSVLADIELEKAWSSETNVYDNLLVIHGILRENHGLVVKENEDDKWESSQFECLVGSRHGLFQSYSTREVVRLENFAAVGSGREYALGVVEALGMDNPQATLRRAVAVATEYDKDTGGRVSYWTSPIASLAIGSR